MGTPALLDAQSGKVLSAVNQSSAALYRQVLVGGFIDDNSSGVSSWEATVDIDMTRTIIKSLSGAFEVAALSGEALTSTFDADGSAAVGYGAIVADNSSGTPSIDAEWSDLGASAAPTDAEISDSLGHHDWVRIANVTATVTGASAGTFAFDNTARSGIVDSGFNGGLAESEDAFNG